MSPVAGASTRPAAPSAQGVTRSVPALEPSGDEGSVPDVSVTIVTYQCKDLVLTCLESLTDGARASQLEVIIVDNGSTDGVVEAVKDRYPDLRVIEVGGNDGFGRSHNLAASHATGRYLLVLNPDTFVEPGAIDTLVRFADERERLGHPVGMVAPRLLNPDGTDQRTARAFPTASAGLFGRRSPLDSSVSAESLVAPVLGLRSHRGRRAVGRRLGVGGRHADPEGRVRRARWFRPRLLHALRGRRAVSPHRCERARGMVRTPVRDRPR